MQSVLEFAMTFDRATFFLTHKLSLVLFTFLIVQGVYTSSMLNAFDHRLLTERLQIENRISKDLARLPLPDKSENVIGDQQQLSRYLNDLNTLLAQRNSVISVHSIEHRAYAESVYKDTMKTVLLDTPSHSIRLVFSQKAPTWYELMGPWALIVSVVTFFLLNQRKLTKDELALAKEDVPESQKMTLVIDLETKCLINSVTQVSVPLANKPLCFYTALIEFCIEDKDTILNQNKALPEHLLTLSDKYFHRLIELGHTIRKRPNFSNSLEKTLSEIRAALDECFKNDPEVKALFYPPKAHGEGSRSKLHHYGLTAISKADIEIKGK